MLKHNIRIIPILTFNGFSLVKTKKFKSPRTIGNPIQNARIFNSRLVDELIFLDITATKQKRKINLKVVKEVLNECFMPVGVGGGITSIEDINDLLKIGADKVIIKSIALLKPEFVQEAASEFGSQCICIAVDAVFKKDTWMIYNDLGIEIKVKNFIEQMDQNGAGELCVTSVDNDGEMTGFNLDLAKYVRNISNLPIIFSGGAKEPQSYVDLIKEEYFEGVAGASIFAFTQYTNLDIAKELAQNGFPIRNTSL